MFWMRNKENNFLIRTLIWRPELHWNLFYVYVLINENKELEKHVYVNQMNNTVHNRFDTKFNLLRLHRALLKCAHTHLASIAYC